jgi:hypothetical protein
MPPKTRMPLSCQATAECPLRAAGLLGPRTCVKRVIHSRPPPTHMAGRRASNLDEAPGQGLGAQAVDVVAVILLAVSATEHVDCAAETRRRVPASSCTPQHCVSERRRTVDSPAGNTWVLPAGASPARPVAAAVAVLGGGSPAPAIASVMSSRKTSMDELFVSLSRLDVVLKHEHLIMVRMESQFFVCEFF